jgi:hypothetical protein
MNTDTELACVLYEIRSSSCWKTESKVVTWLDEGRLREKPVALTSSCKIIMEFTARSHAAIHHTAVWHKNGIHCEENAQQSCNINRKIAPLLIFWHRSFTFNSNKLPTWCNSFSVYYPDVCLRLSMFRAFFRPSLGAQWLQWQPLVLPSYRGDIRAVFVVGPAGPTTNTARLSPRYEGKTRGCHCSHWAPDDGWENSRNMLSCKQTSG